MPTARFFEVVLPVKLVYNQRYLASPASPDMRALAHFAKERGFKFHIVIGNPLTKIQFSS